jgi:hypothetical protein
MIGRMTTPRAPATLLAIALVGLGCGPAETPPAPPAACNGHEALCARRYDEVAYATTHNAYSVDAEGFVAANQHEGIPRQLQDGVRAMMLDVKEDAGALALCHGPCGIGRRPLDDALVELRTFLDANPREVLTLQLESYVTGAAVAEAFARTGLVRYAYTPATPTPGAPWPTLGEMVAAGTRLVTFYEDGRSVAGEGAPAWYLPLFRHSFDTPFGVRTPEDLTCVVKRGSPTAALFTLNHFLSLPNSTPEAVARVNTNPFLVERALECQRTFGRIPNFVAVDFYDVGDLLAAVRTLNGL